MSDSNNNNLPLPKGYASLEDPNSVVVKLCDIPDSTTSAQLGVLGFREAPAAVAAFVPEVNPNYIFRLETWKHEAAHYCAAELAPEQMRNFGVLIYGPPGSGKSSAPAQLAARLNTPVFRVACSGETTEDDLWGRDTLMGDEIVHIPGPLTRALQYGGWIILDEFFRLDPSVAGSLQPVLDPDAKLANPKQPETPIKRHQNFRLFATSNVKTGIDPTGQFQALNLQDAALLDRMDIHEYPAVTVDELLAQFPRFDQAVSDRPVLEAIAEVIIKTQTGNDDQHTALPPLTPRDFGRICTTFIGLVESKAPVENAPLSAFETCLKRYSAETRDAYLQIAKAICGTFAPAD